MKTLGDNWLLSAYNFFLNDTSFIANTTKTMHIDSHLPYLYMPKADYTHFGFVLNELYANLTVNKYWEGCEYGPNYCRFNVSCDLVKSDSNVNIPFTIELNDSLSTYNLTAINSNMFVDGDNFGKRTGSYCYIPVFHSDLPADNNWYVGSLFMSQYVVVYDNTPH